MADNVFSPEQQEIIRHRDSSVLVSAGAGCGKTFVLTKRLMEYLNPGSVIPGNNAPPESIDRFMVITFTRAAASELKSRISQSISAAISQEERGENRREIIERLRTQSALLPRANIGTIHSACTSILREFGSLVGVRPGFRVIEDERAENLRAGALERILEERYSNPDKYPGFILLADTIGAGRDDSALARLIIEVYDKTRSHPRPELWIEEQKTALLTDYTDIAKTPWGAEILDYARSSMEYTFSELKAISDELVCAEKCLAGNAAVIEAIIQQASALYNALRPESGCSWDDIRGKCSLDPPRAKPVTKAEDRVLAAKFKRVKDDSVKSIRKIHALFNSPGEKCLQDLKNMAPALCALLDAVNAFDKDYSEVKAQSAYLDFNDLEHFASRLLTDGEGRPSDTARLLASRYREIMVDEFQDVSNIQDSIFRAISNEGRNLFFVGDVKQSVYRFRLANPQIFLDYYKNYDDFRSSGAESEGIRVPLRSNYRSRGSVLDAVNSVFSKIMSEAAGDVDYSDPDQQLYVGDSTKYDGAAPKPELIIIGRGDSDEEDAEDGDSGSDESPDLKRSEAAIVAEKIFKIVNVEKPLLLDGDKLRPARYDDVAILLRSPKNTETYYRSELEKRGIPVSSGTGGDFFEAPEICWLRAMLSVIDNPNKDIELISVLRSPAFGCTPDELSEIRGAAGKKELNLFGALKLAAENTTRFDTFLQWLDEFRTLSRDIPVSRLVWELVCRADLLALCAAMPDGEQHRGRVLKFIELASSFEDSGYRGIHKFVNWLQRLEQKSENVKLPAAGGGAGVIIMSTHRSKGLEFPIVFVCGLGKHFNKADTMASVLVHPTLGLGSRAVDLENGTYSTTVAGSAISHRLSTELVSEELRILYVALTRAREQLFLVGSVKALETFRDKLPSFPNEGAIPPEWILNRSGLLPILAAAAELDNGNNLSLIFQSVGAYEEYIKKEEQAGVFLPDKDEKQDRLTRLEKNLSFEYPHQACVELPSKVTATQLRQEASPDPDSAYLLESEEGEHSLYVPLITTSKPLKPFSSASKTIKPNQAPLKLPDFSGNNGKLTGTDKGTATHIALQHIDLAKAGSAADISAELTRLTEQGFLTAREAASVDESTLLTFYSSEVGQELRSAPLVRREFRFSLLTPAEELLGRGGDDTVLLQGAVDCFLEYDSSITLIDYKTDRVSSEEEIMARAEHYRSQLEIYASALQRICGKPVTKKIIYFLTPGAFITL